LAAGFPIGRKVVVGKLEKRQHLEYLQVDVGIILKWILNKWDSLHGLDESGSG
jgi:hypothetical protein